MIYLLTAVVLTAGGSSTVHTYTQTIHRTTQSTQTVHRTTQLANWEECGPCPVFERYTLAFVLQMRKKHGKTSVMVAEECQLAR
jgi:quinolinate synthase